MSPRCSALLPVSADHPKPLRCRERGLRRVDGAVVCRGHSDACKSAPVETVTKWRGRVRAVGGPRLLEEPGHCGACRQGEHLFCALRWEGAEASCDCPCPKDGVQ